MATRWIPKLAWSHVPSLYDHCFLMHLHTHSTMNTKSIYELIRSWPARSSPNSLDHAFRGNLHPHLITTCLCMSEILRSRPWSASLSSLDRSLHPSASLNSLNHSFQVYRSAHTLGVPRCSSGFFWVPTAARLTVCKFIERLKLLLYAILWCSKSWDWKNDECDTQNAMWLCDPQNHCCDNAAPSLNFPTGLHSGLSSCSWSLHQP